MIRVGKRGVATFVVINFGLKKREKRGKKRNGKKGEKKRRKKRK